PVWAAAPPPLLGPVARPVAALVGRDRAEARVGERRYLAPPRVGELREAVTEDDGPPPSGLVHRQRHRGRPAPPPAGRARGAPRRAPLAPVGEPMARELDAAGRREARHAVSCGERRAEH